MSEHKTIDISGIRLESPAFPTAADRALWDSLSPEAQEALIRHELDDAEKSGPAQSETMEELIARVRDKKA